MAHLDRARTAKRATSIRPGPATLGTMDALVATGDPRTLLEMRQVEEPSPGPNEALVEVRAVSINRGELRLLASRPDGWRPGQTASRSRPGRRCPWPD